MRGKGGGDRDEVRRSVWRGWRGGWDGVEGEEGDGVRR